MAQYTAIDDPVNVTPQSIAALDGFFLAATEYAPPGTRHLDRPLILISAAAAVPQSYYTKFATWLSESGYQAITYDYRGIGRSRPHSLRSFEARMRDWGELDLAGVLDWAEKTWPGRPIYNIGHSIGGFAPGLAHNNHLIAKQVNIATLSGHWRFMKDRERYKVAFFMFTLMPLITRVWGYFPGWVMGNAEDMPRGVMLEWARWCRSGNFLFDDPSLSSKKYFEQFEAPLRAYQFSDDVWGTKRAVGHITERYVRAKNRHIRSISPADIGTVNIGHMGFFRERFRDTLWPDAAEWLFQEL